jgi:hypothetical protein
MLFFMHFTGTMDHWDPALTDGFAQDREVILFNNAGISSSSGEVPTSIEEMAQHAAAFIDALGVRKIDASATTTPATDTTTRAGLRSMEIGWEERSPSMRCGHTRIRFLMLCRLGGMLRSIQRG